MKNAIVFAAAFLLLFAAGQEAGAQDFGSAISEKGVKLSLNVTNGMGDDVNQGEASPTFGFAPSVGAFATYQLADQLGVGLELLYSQRKFGIDHPDYEYYHSVQHAVEIPLLVKYSFMELSEYRPVGYLGPSFVIPVAHKIIYEDQLSGEEYYHNLYNAVDFEFGMNFGLGASIEAGDGFITGDLRYYLGLTPFNSEMTAADLGNLEGNDEIIATPSGVGFDEPTAKHMAIMLMIGYSF